MHVGEGLCISTAQLRLMETVLVKNQLAYNIWNLLYFLTILQGTRIIKKKMGSPMPFSKYREPNIMHYLCVF